MDRDLADALAQSAKNRATQPVSKRRKPCTHLEKSSKQAPGEDMHGKAKGRRQQAQVKKRGMPVNDMDRVQ